ncbi:N/A [soil metagenome]
MRAGIASRAANVCLRGIALSARFVLIFSLARFLEPAEVGLYGLVFVTITYVQYALGMDFCIWANRELIAADRERWTALLRDQGVFYLLTYAVVLPLAILLFAFDVLPWKVAGWFFVLLVLEHVAHELSRILIATSQPVLATTMLFLRAGVWVLVLVPLMWIEPAARSLNYVFFGWTLGALLACLLGAGRLAAAGSWDLRRAVDWRWLWSGLRVAAPLLVATLCLKGLTTFDRYWIESIAGLEVLGAYVLFVGIANAIKAFLDAGIFVFSYPSLIRAAHAADEPAFRGGMRRLAWQTGAASVVLLGASLVLIQPLLSWVDRPIYGEHVVLLYWSLAAVALYAAGAVFHYGIYAHRMDYVIVLSHAASLIVFVLSAAALVPLLGVVAVPVALCFAYGLILIWKLSTYLRIRFGGGAVAPREKTTPLAAG